MAKIRDREPKSVSGEYSRVFGNEKLGMLISKVHATSISDGGELERIVQSKVRTVLNLDEFLGRDIMPDGVFLVTKRQIKKCQMLGAHNSEPDFIIFKRRDNEQRCHVIELKAGHAFDTKKASAERRALHEFVEKNARNMKFMVSIHFCAFNRDDRQAVQEGFKNKINIEEAMTGREFCELLEIDYDEIVLMRSKDAQDNFRYFIAELLKIPEARQMVLDLLNEQEVRQMTLDLPNET